MADETEKKFIFTADGRKLLVSQVGGIKFAVLGVALVYTEKTLVPEEPEADFNLTLDDLSLENNVVLGLKKIYYTTVSIPDKEYGSIAPEDTNKYINALNDLEKYLIPVHYKPTLEKQDQFGNAYGTYDFDVDKTTLSWDMGNNIAFKYIVLFGKQYAETSDATFNVDKTQKPTVIGIVKYPEDSVIMFNKEASDYCAEKVQLTFTITDIDEKCELDITSEEVLEASKKLSLINNGLYTRKDDEPNVGVSMNIAGTKTIIEDLDLDVSGALAMTKTLMVAETTNSTELVEQLNPGSMVHIVNNEIKDESTEKVDYKPQLIFTTIEGEANQDLTQEITAYNTIFSLHGKGNDLSTNDAIITGIESPIFELNSIPTNDRYAVNIFGHNNKLLEDKNNPDIRNIDVSLFSNDNTSMEPHDNYNRNAFIFANSNFIKGNSYANLLLGINSTQITENSHHNVIIGNNLLGISNRIINSSYNRIFGASESKISASNEKSQSNYNTIIGGSRNNIDDSSQILMLALGGLSAINTDNQVLMGKWNIPIENAAFIFGYGDQGNNRNLMELYPNGELKLFNSNGTNTVTLGGDAGVQLSNLTVTSISADHGCFNKKLYVGDQGGNGYPYKGLYVNYNSTTNDTSFNISQGYNGANLSYRTSDETLWISHSYYQDPNHDNYAAINNEYARFGYYNKDGIVSVKTSILVNGDITGPDTETKEDGTLTVYRQNEVEAGLISLKIRNKVNIHASNIQFNEYNPTSNSWELVKEIGPHENNRISMDVYIFGTDATNWSTTIAGIRGGTAQQKVFLYDLFTKTPPIGYLPDDQIGTTPYVCYVDSSTQEVKVRQIASMTQEERTAYNTALANNNSSVFNNNPFNDASIGIPTPYNYYHITRLPLNIEEIEVNLYIRGFLNADSFMMMWIPTVNSSTYNNIFKEPVIKMNIIRPGYTTTEHTIKTAFYRNINYLTLTGYTVQPIDADYDTYDTVKLMCRPYICDDTDNGYAVHYDTEAHSCCWTLL